MCCVYFIQKRCIIAWNLLSFGQAKWTLLLIFSFFFSNANDHSTSTFHRCFIFHFRECSNCYCFSLLFVLFIYLSFSLPVLTMLFSFIFPCFLPPSKGCSYCSLPSLSSIPSQFPLFIFFGPFTVAALFSPAASSSPSATSSPSASSFDSVLLLLTLPQPIIVRTSVFCCLPRFCLSPTCFSPCFLVTYNLDSWTRN